MGFGAFPLGFPDEGNLREVYSLEVRDGDGRLVGFLRELTAATLERKLRSPARLDIEAHVDNESLALITGRNEVWVRRLYDDALEGRFRLERKTESLREDSVAIVLYDALFWLRQHFLFAYNTSATVAAHVAAWLADTGITVGKIDSSIGDLEREFDFGDQDTVLHALTALEETLEWETHYWIDSNLVFHWRRMSEDIENHIRVGREIGDLEREIDYSEAVGRLYAFGSAAGGERVKLSDADGVTLDYITASGAAWPYEKEISVGHEAVEIEDDYAGVASFALHVVLAADASLARYANADGGDIAFFRADGTQLTHELVSYDSATGALEAWVALDASAVADTTISMRYGGGVGAASTVDHDPSDKSDAWQDTYEAMEAAPSAFISVGQPVARIGTATGVAINNRIEDPVELMTWALQELERRNRERVSYRVTVENFDAISYHPEREITLGAKQRLLDVDRAIDVSEYVVRIALALLRPADTVIELSELFDREPPEVAMAEDQDTVTTWLPDDKIYLDPEHEYSVDDWEYKDMSDPEGNPTGSTGEMDGDKIRAGTIPRVVPCKITEVTSATAPQRYKIEELDGDKNSLTPAVTYTDAFVADDNGEALSVGDYHTARIPSEDGLAAGEKPLIIVGGAGGGENWSYVYWREGT